MNRALRQMLDQVAERTTALIFAPPSYADRFDDFGCVDPTAWELAEMEIADEQIHVAHDAHGQAEQVAGCLAWMELPERLIASTFSESFPG